MMPTCASAGQSCSEEDALGLARLLLHAIADLEQLLRGCAAIRRRGDDARGHLVLQAGDSNLEELVRVLAENRQELGSFEQRDVVALRQREYPSIEVEPRQLTVQQPGVD